MCGPGVAKSRSPHVKLLQLPEAKPPKLSNSSALGEARVPRVLSCAAARAALPWRKQYMVPRRLAKFSARNMRVMSSVMLKGTLMIRTGVWMWLFMPLNIRAHTQRSGPTWSSSVAQASESVTSQAVRSRVKHRKLYWFEVSIFTGASHAALTCHKSNFFNCSYVTKNYSYQLRPTKKMPSQPQHSNTDP